VPLSVESMSPVGAFIIICHVFAFAVDTFEGMRAEFILFSFQSKGICFEVCFTAPCHISVMFNLVRPTTFLTLRTMDFAQECRVTPFLAVVALRDARVHVSASYSDYVSVKVE